MNGKTTSVNFRQLLFVAALAVAFVVGCSSSPSGTYTDGTGQWVLVFNSGGNATFTFEGQPLMCTYTSSGKMVSLTCPGQAGALVLTVQNDGSLAGPAGTFLPHLRKK